MADKYGVNNTYSLANSAGSNAHYGAPTGYASASFNNGRYGANTTYWDPNANGGTGAYVTTDNYLNTPAYMGVDDMNASVGLMTNRADAQRIYNDATRAQGIANRAAWQNTANQTYDQMRANQDSVLQNMRRQQAQAILNGAAKGISAATQLNAILGMNDQNAALMRDMRQQQAQTYVDENAQLARNVRDALEYTDANRQYLGNIARDRYDIDWQAAQAWVTAQADLLGQSVAGASNNYAAQQALAGTKYAADQAAAAERYAADRSYAAAVAAAARTAAAGNTAADLKPATDAQYRLRMGVEGDTGRGQFQKSTDGGKSWVNVNSVDVPAEYKTPEGRLSIIAAPYTSPYTAK